MASVLDHNHRSLVGRVLKFAGIGATIEHDRENDVILISSTLEARVEALEAQVADLTAAAAPAVADEPEVAPEAAVEETTAV